MCEGRQILSGTLALFGILAFLGSSEAGNFTVRVFEHDGVTLATGVVTLKVKDTKGNTPSTLQTATGSFGTFFVVPDTAATDKTLTFEFYRSGTLIRSIDGINGISSKTQLIETTLK